MRIVSLFLKLAQAKNLKASVQKKRENSFMKEWNKLDYEEQIDFLKFIQPLNGAYCVLTKERRCQNVD